MSKKTKYIFYIIFIIYFFISLIINIIKSGMFQDISKNVEIITSSIVINIFAFLLFMVFITMIQNIWLIILFVAIKLGVRSYKKDKLTNIDFKKDKEYYREILEKYSPLILSYIDDFNIDTQTDCIASILYLQKNGYISIENNKIVYNKKDTINLDENEIYILSCIKDGKIELNEYELIKKIQKDGVEKGLLEEKKDFKKRKAKKILMAVAIFFVILAMLIFIVFNLQNKYIDNSLLIIMIFIILGTSLITLVSYPFIMTIYMITYIIAESQNPLFRTKRGEMINKKIEGLRSYLQDYSLLSEKDSKDIIIWEEYLIYSVLFHQNTKIIEEYKKYIK